LTYVILKFIENESKSDTPIDGKEHHVLILVTTTVHLVTIICHIEWLTRLPILLLDFYILKIIFTLNDAISMYSQISAT